MDHLIDGILVSGSAVSKLDLRRYLGAREIATPVDYGAVEGGIADCAPAFAAALAAAKAVFVPPGVWRIASPIVLGYGQSLFGVGDGSVIQARPEPWDGTNLPTYPSSFNAIEVQSGYCSVRDLKIVGGATAIKLYGRQGPCVKNVIENLSIWDAQIGITFDGYDNTNRPCYWNHLARILVARPLLHGILTTVESTGDTPNANKFHDVRVYSLSAPMSGCGFFLSCARYNNSFIDCEANLHPSAEACFRLGALTDQTRVINFYAECSGAVPGIRIDNGSQNTTIINLFSATGGAHVWDTSAQRKYMAFSAGFPTTSLLKTTTITDLSVEGLSYATRFIEAPPGNKVTPDFTVATLWLISSYAGAVEVDLPAPASCPGRVGIVKKSDVSTNAVTVTTSTGGGPDSNPVVLGKQEDFVALVSNGASWWIISRHYDTPIRGWANPAGGFNADDYGDLGYAVKALILDLKTKGILGD